MTNRRSVLRASRFASRVGLLSLACALAAPLLAEGPEVRATLVAPATAAPGSSARLAVELTVGPKWHVNSHTPSEDFLIPTNVTLRTTGGSLSAVRYPKDIVRKFAFWDKPLRVYEGTLRFEADLAVPKGASGKLRVAGTLSYQACNDQQCFAPAEIPLEATLTVSGSAR